MVQDQWIQRCDRGVYPQGIGLEEPCHSQESEFRAQCEKVQALMTEFLKLIAIVSHLDSLDDTFHITLDLGAVRRLIKEVGTALDRTLVGCVVCGSGIEPRNTVLGMCPRCAERKLKEMNER